MRLSKKLTYMIFSITALLVAVTFAVLANLNIKFTFAEGENTNYYSASDAHFVHLYNNGKKLTIKTSAKTVRAVIERAGITLNDSDRVEPSLDAEINADNFFINIYHAHPVVLVDGNKKSYIMASSYDPRTIFEDAGITVYDGDEIKPAANAFFLETGAAIGYEIIRNGGRNITVAMEIPFPEQTVRDYNLPVGTSEVRQLGELGQKSVVYNVLYVKNQEASRTLVSEAVVKNPVPRIVAVGAKKSVSPAWATCADWARAAGIAEADLPIALDIIYRESGCRVDARNTHSGAYGIPQALPGRKMAKFGADWETNPVTQIRWMDSYVKGRYGSWQGVAAWWDAHHWY